MGKVDFRTLTAEERQKLWREMEKVLLELRTADAITTFLSDLLTESERVMTGRRIRIAQFLLAGMSVEDICMRLHVGIATVQSVDRWLRKSAPDYRSIFTPLYQESRTRKIPSTILATATFMVLRKKYPVHALLFRLFLDDSLPARGT